MIVSSKNHHQRTVILQQDLDRLQQWTHTWQMKFNTDKCHSMTFFLVSQHHRDKLQTRKHSNALTSVSDYPYLGLTFTSNMSWSKHISKATTRANRILGLIRRNLRGTSVKIKEKAYLTLVCPHLEYCSAIWNPYTKKDISRIENIQRQAAGFVLNRYMRTESVSKMLQKLQWASLEERRKRSSLLIRTKFSTVSLQ